MEFSSRTCNKSISKVRQSPSFMGIYVALTIMPLMEEEVEDYSDFEQTSQDL
jgi:hypothetical protein